MKSYKFLEPEVVLKALGYEPNLFFLDSSLNRNLLGRFSFLGIKPFFIFKSRQEEPFLRLRKEFKRYRIPSLKLPFYFVGGLVGYLSYDLVFSLEKKVTPQNKPSLDIPDCFFGFYNSIFIFDHLKKKFYILCLGIPEKEYLKSKTLAKENFKQFRKMIERVNFYKKKKEERKKTLNVTSLTSDFTQKKYIKAVIKAKEYISRGDIYQINLSQKFKAKINGVSSIFLYERLRRENPSCFSAYLDGGEFQILSSSPERFLKLENGLLITRPMKGTRPRAKDKRKDRELKKELLRSPKDKAELVMIVDLERNDLGKVCEFGSVRVERLRELETYKTVYQTTATIVGKLKANNDCFDVLEACFPGGSITGCPKIRAMQIIEELEQSRRMVYTGSLGYISFSGDMEFNILIRTILRKNNTLYFGVGGGIVADSSPEEEYRETLVKAKGMLKAIGYYNGNYFLE